MAQSLQARLHHCAESSNISGLVLVSFRNSLVTYSEALEHRFVPHPFYYSTCSVRSHTYPSRLLIHRYLKGFCVLANVQLED